MLLDSQRDGDREADDPGEEAAGRDEGDNGEKDLRGLADHGITSDRVPAPPQHADRRATSGEVAALGLASVPDPREVCQTAGAPSPSAYFGHVPEGTSDCLLDFTAMAWWRVHREAES